MAPTCESCSKRDDAAAPAAVVPDPCDTRPFHGMFDSHEDESYESGSIARQYQGASRHVIPEASETFLRVMRQLDSAQKGDIDPDPAITSSSSRSTSSNGTRPKELKSTASATCDKSAAREPKSVKVVKKSASFSAQHASTSLQSCSSATNTSSSSSTTTTTTTTTKKNAGSRRLSVPCTRSERHVQWADQVGAGAQLVSVRLIRPRLELKDDDKASSPARSILRRLGVVAKDDKPVSEERSLFRRLGVGRR